MTDAVNPDYEDAYYKLLHKDSKEKPITEQQKAYVAKRWRTDLMQQGCKICGKETCEKICSECFYKAHLAITSEPIDDEKAHAAQKALGLLNYASGPEAFKKFFGHNLHENLVQLNADGSPRLSGDDELVNVFTEYNGTKERCGNCGDQTDKIECDSNGYFISAWRDDCIGEIEQQNMQTKAMAYYAYCKELESDNFDFSSFSPSEFESAQRKNKLPRTLGAIPPDFNPKPPFNNAAQHEKSKANQTVIVILFNGETGEWEAWEDGDSDPMYRHENVLEVVNDCLCDYEVIEVHNNA